ncbi:MAG: hypothetical protein ABFS28_14155 [Bacteroidota bacterium]
MKSPSGSPTREINKRLLLSIHQDGFFDILAGLIVINFGWVPILDATGLNPGVRQTILLTFYGLSIVIVIWLKRRITVPRSGYVKLAKKTRSRLSIVMLIVNMVLFVIFGGIYLLDIPLWSYFGSYQMSVPLGLIFMVLFSFTGGLLKAVRFYLYGILVLFSFIGSEHLFLVGRAAHHGIPLAAFVSGGIIFLSGCIFLSKFMRRYSA